MTALAEDLYLEVVSRRFSTIPRIELDIICQKIREAPGNRAMAIYKAQMEGWWDQDLDTARTEIMKAPGNRAMVLYWLKMKGQLPLSDEETCKLILESPGDVEFVKYLAEKTDWWCKTEDQAHDIS